MKKSTLLKKFDSNKNKVLNRLAKKQKYELKQFKASADFTERKLKNFIKKQEKHFNFITSLIEEIRKDYAFCEGFSLYTSWGPSQAQTSLKAYSLEYIEGQRTSGWGYDKLSTAQANALNKSKSFIFWLFVYAPTAYCLYFLNNDFYDKNIFGTMPLIDGGGGESTIIKIFELMNFNRVAAHYTKNQDFIQFEYSKKLTD